MKIDIKIYCKSNLYMHFGDMIYDLKPGIGN